MTRKLLLLVALLVSLGSIASAAAPDAQNCVAPNWEGRFYNATDFSGLPVHTSCDASINFVWDINPPAGGVNPDNFSVRWTSIQTFATAGNYQFTLIVEDGARLFVNGAPIINSLDDAAAPRTLSGVYEAPTAGSTAFITLEMVNFTGPAQAQLTWSLVSGGVQTTPVPDTSIPTTGGGQPWLVEYYNNLIWQEPVVATATAPADGISRNYGTTAPAENVTTEGWSSRWTRVVDFPAGTYVFTARADDGIRVLFDGVEIINQAQFADGATFTSTVEIPNGQHTIIVEYFNEVLDANLFLTWDPPVGTSLLPDGCNGQAAGVNGNAEPCEDKTAQSQITMGVTVRAGPLNVRIAPSLEAQRLDQISRGERYTASGRTADNIWVLLNVNGTIGWSMSEFLTLDGDIQTLPILTETPVLTDGETDGTSAVVTTPVFTGVQARALGFIRIRSAPNVNADRVYGVGWGTIVNVIGRNAAGDWLQVEVDGVQGWTARTWYDIVQGELTSVPVTN